MSHSPAPWSIRGVEIMDANDKHVVWELGNSNAADHALLMAAPDLLAALKYLLELGGDDDRRIAAETAIAKAEGGIPAADEAKR